MTFSGAASVDTAPFYSGGLIVKRKINIKKRIIISVISCFALVVCCYMVYEFSKPIILSYEQIEEHITITELDGNLYILCDMNISEVNHLGNSGGTEFIKMTDDDTGRCYKQSLQVTTSKWDTFFHNQKVIIYKNKLESHGALSGESVVINDDMTVSTVPRYDTEIYYRDPSGNEYLLWTVNES